MRATAVTDIGKTRAVNQDYVYTSVDSIGCLPNLLLLQMEWEDTRLGIQHHGLL